MNDNTNFQDFLRQGIRAAGKRYFEEERRKAEAARRATDDDRTQI